MRYDKHIYFLKIFAYRSYALSVSHQLYQQVVPEKSGDASFKVTGIF